MYKGPGLSVFDLMVLPSNLPTLLGDTASAQRHYVAPTPTTPESQTEVRTRNPCMVTELRKKGDFTLGATGGEPKRFPASSIASGC